MLSICFNIIKIIYCDTKILTGLSLLRRQLFGTNLFSFRLKLGNFDGIGKTERLAKTEQIFPNELLEEEAR